MTNGRTGPADDAALVDAMAAGSEAALEALYDRYAGGIFAAVYRLTSDRGIAEEIVQETFLTMWDRAESFDPAVGTLSAWLHAIARNRAIDRLRAIGRRPRLVELSSAAGADEDPTRAMDRLVTSGSIVSGSTPPLDPEMAFEMVGAREAIRAALGTMTDDERTVILLAYQEELTQSEIADRLGWPLGTVKTRTRRALRRLRERLGPDFAPVGDDMTAPIRAVDD